MFGVLLFSGVIGLLVYVARNQPADNTQCLKISPTSGQFAYVYFDAHNGTRLNMPRHDPFGHFEEIGSFNSGPNGIYRASILRSVATPIYYLSVENIVNGTRHYRALGTDQPSFYGWSADNTYFALKMGG